MALTLVLTQALPGCAITNRPATFQVAVTSTVSASLTGLAVSESTQTAQISQPNFLTPNVPIGTGFPTLTAATASYFTFPVVFTSPNTPGASPNNPGGASPTSPGVWGNFNLVVTALASDGSTATASLLVPVLSAIAPYPPPLGGAFQFNQAADFVNLMLLGAL